VDGEWFAPHFEKMLYDNAQLISLYSEAFSLTQNPDYRRAVYETFQWLQREMTHPDGAFYSALDADSEDVEGKYYTWTYAELEQLLGSDASLFCEYFGVTPAGNWEHGQNILKRVRNHDDFLTTHALGEEQWNSILLNCKATLLKAREGRTRPGLDDKIVTGWNAMTICALVDAYHAFKDDTILAAAKNCMHFLEENVTDDTILHRSFKERPSPTLGFLEDYAYMISAYLKLYQADFNDRWLDRAGKLTVFTVNHFLDNTDGLFYFTGSSAEKLIARKKELFDNVIPSSNSIMAMNLHRMGILMDSTDWRELAQSMINGFANLIVSEPNYMSNWGIAYMELHATLAEVVIVGRNTSELKSQIARRYLPFALYSGTDTESDLPMLRGKVAMDGRTTIFVCRNYSCQQPMHEPEDAIRLITNKQ
jgi:uncharacterized protein YyaL (SSP411 family)